MDLTPTTQLDAINELLNVIGEEPVNTLDVSGFTDVSIAQDVLRATSRGIQSRGWWFNTDPSVTLQPDASGSVDIPPAAIRITSSLAEGRMLTQRNGKLYDRTNQTATFSSETPPIAKVVWFFDFETLPESVRRYVTMKAARVFQARVLGSATLYKFTREDEQEAAMLVIREEDEQNPGNMLNDSAQATGIWQEGGA